MKVVKPDEQALREALRAIAQQTPILRVDLSRLVASRPQTPRVRRHIVLAVTVSLAILAASAVTVTMMSNPQDNDKARMAPPGTLTVVPCPQTLAAWQRGPVRSEAREEFVPPGARSVTICRYEAPSGTPLAGQSDPALMRLSRAGDLSGAVLSDLVEALNTAPAGHMRCPGNPTVVVLARFHYATGPDVEVRMGVAACWSATNGARDATASGVTIPGFVEPVNQAPSGPTALRPLPPSQ
jgi:hypothetical protein